MPVFPRISTVTMVAAAVTVSLAFAPLAAGAVSVSYSDAPGGGLAVTAPAGEANDVSLALECDGACAFTVVEQFAVLATAGPGCILASVQPATVRCAVGAGPRTVRVDLGDEDDRLAVACAAPVRVVADLGPGNDRFRGCTTGGGSADDVAGGPGNDILDTAGGDDILDGGTGRDRLRAGRGADTLRTRDGERDEVSCGTDPGSEGVDVVTVRAGLALSGTDRATVDPGDGLPRDCEHIESARVGERNGILPRAHGVARVNARGEIIVRFVCRRAACTGRARADLAVSGRRLPAVPGGLASTLSMQSSYLLTGAVTLSRADARALRRGGERIRVARVSAFERGRKGFRITVVAIPVRG